MSSKAAYCEMAAIYFTLFSTSSPIFWCPGQVVSLNEALNSPFDDLYVGRESGLQLLYALRDQ